MIHAMHDLADQWRPHAILVENKSSGQSAVQELQRSKLPVIAINVDTDKTARARAAAPKAESGKIWILRHASWARLYLDELCNFPKSEFNHQGDSSDPVSQLDSRASLGPIAIYKAENQRVRLDKIRRGEPILYLIPGMPLEVRFSGDLSTAFLYSISIPQSSFIGVSQLLLIGRQRISIDTFPTMQFNDS